MTLPGSTSQVAGGTHDRGHVSQWAPVQQLVRTSYERSALTVDEYAEAIISHAESGPEVSRRKLARRRLDILQDAHAPLVLAELENSFTPEVFEAVTGRNRDKVDISRNPAKRIWKETACLYNRPPKRSTERKSDIKAYNKLLKGTKFDLFWQEVEERLQACNSVVVWPEVVTLPDGKKAVKHRWACPDKFTIVTSKDDPTYVEALCFRDEYTDLVDKTRRVRWVLWTPDWHAQYERPGKGKPLKRTGLVPAVAPEDEDKIDPADNPYGRIVHVLISRSYANDEVLDQTSGEDLVGLTVSCGERRTVLRRDERMSGFKQMVVAGAALDKPPQWLMDPAYVPMVEGSDAKIIIVDWQVDIKARQEVMDRDEERAAASRGINPQQYKNAGDYQNATQARGAERGLTEQRIRDATIWADAEAAYARSLALVAERGGVKDGPPEDIELEVQYAPIEYPTDPREQAELDKTRISLGLESAVTVCQREHPTWTEEQCWKFIENNLKATARVNDMKTRHNVPDDPENESASAEENGHKGGRPPAGDDQNPMQSPPGAAPGSPTAPQE